MKLLVCSTLNMDDADFRYYAERNAERCKNLPPEEFIEKIKNGERVIIKYPDGTTTSYEMVADN